MTDEQFRAAKSTFPWFQRTYTIPHKQGGIIQVVDKNGVEVQLFEILAVMTLLTTHIANQSTPQAHAEAHAQQATAR